MKIRRTILGIALAAIVTIVTVWFISKPKPAVATAPVDQAILDLTVDMDAETVLAKFKDVPWTWLDYSMPSRAGERLRETELSDAVSFPFEGKKDGDGQTYTDAESDQFFDELEEEILRNPVMGDMVGRALADVVVVDGTDLTSINPWLADFIKESDEFYALPEDQHPRGVEHWVVYKTTTSETGEKTYVLDDSGNRIIEVTRDYRVDAAKLCILLERMKKLGVGNYESARNWCLNATPIMSSTRTLEADYQEHKDSLLLAYTRKNNAKVVFIGFNLTDKRIEVFDPKAKAEKVEPPAPEQTTETTDTDTPKPTPSTGTSTPTPSTGTPTSTGEPPAPTPVINDPPKPDPTPTNPDPTPTKPDPQPETKPDKTPADDAVNQDPGKADTGGGENKSTDGSGDFQPTDPVNAPPAANDQSQHNEGHADPASAVPVTPAPAATDPARADVQVDNTDNNQITYQPDDQSDDTTWTDTTDASHQASGQDGADNDAKNDGGTPAADAADDAPTGGNGSLAEPID